jgi:transcriptional/translational regulatory protein YebC/TACO1
MVNQMEKQEVVNLITNTVRDMNIELARKNNVPEESIMRMAQESAPQMDIISGIIYDVLEANGVIA